MKPTRHLPGDPIPQPEVVEVDWNEWLRVSGFAPTEPATLPGDFEPKVPDFDATVPASLAGLSVTEQSEDPTDPVPLDELFKQLTAKPLI